MIGGIVLPAKYAMEFEQELLAARSPHLPINHSNGEPYELSWNEFKPGRRTMAGYKSVIEAFFKFGARFKSTFDTVRLHASVINTQVKNRHYTGQKGELGFNRELYFHCLRLGRDTSYMTRVFQVYPDYRTTKQLPEQLQGYLCMGLRKHLPNDARQLPYRSVRFMQSHECQAIQISDIIIGAMQYRLNGWMEAPTSNAVKKELCEFILNRGHIWLNCEPDSPKDHNWGICRIWVRKHRSFEE